VRGARDLRHRYPSRDANLGRSAVRRLAYEHPDWIPVLRAACAQAEKSEPYGGEFAGRWVLQELEAATGTRVWQPGLRRLVAYGLLEKAGESTRGGRRGLTTECQREPRLKRRFAALHRG